MRSFLRTDGVRYGRRMEAPIDVPVLHLHGEHDSSILLRSAEGSGEWVTGPYEFCVVDGVGHFPHEEAPERFDALLQKWLLSNRAS